MGSQRFQSLDLVLGIGLCTAAASTLCLFLEKSPAKASAPIYFLVIVSLVAFRFGALAGMLGTIMAAAIFALFLFEPLRSLAVHNAHERNNLIYLIVFGVVISELCGHPAPPGKSTASKTSL
ncbi:MAG TPA: DUF4118 domain-containing protein [Terriglobales bacterium]|jgi:K+-sensing histidine kinase KdpD|nr:DUF4118 domain-containing protein [Terriglobales bacterium]